VPLDLPDHRRRARTPVGHLEDDEAVRERTECHGRVGIHQRRLDLVHAEAGIDVLLEDADRHGARPGAGVPRVTGDEAVGRQIVRDIRGGGGAVAGRERGDIP
jgi:hypothetical protein